MIWLVAKKELYDNWQTHKIKLAFVLCSLLLTMSVWLGLKDYPTRLSSYNLTRMDDTVSGVPVAVYMYLNSDGKPIVFSSMGDMINIIGIYRRPVELGILARGIEDRMNRPVQFFNIRKSGYKAATDIGNPQERNKTSTLYSLPDFLFFTKVVLSLLVILFAYDTIAGERERGTLQLILSNSVSRGQVLLGKFLGGYLSIVLPFLAAAVIALLLLVLSPSVALSGEGWLRILCLLLMSLGYLGVFFFIGLSISAVTSRAATAVLMSLAIWVVLTLIVPNIGWLVGKQLVQVPSQQQIDTEKFKTAREIEDEAEKKKPSDEYIPGYGKWHPEAQSQIEETLKGIDERYATLRQRRLALSQLFTRLSPAGAYVYAATGLAQTGIEDEKQYHAQLKGHESQLGSNIQTLLEASQQILSQSKPPQEIYAYRKWRLKIQEDRFRLVKDLLLASQLNVTFETLPFLDSLHAIRIDLLLLTFWLGLGFAFAAMAFAKCEVRR